MPTIIDSLVVTLGLDTKDVDSKAPGVRRKLSDFEKDSGKLHKTTDDVGKSLKTTGAALGSFLAILGGATVIKSFVRDAIDTNTQLYFLSRNLEMSTQKLFAWGAASQEIGGSKGTIQNFMRTIAGMPGELLIGRMPQLLPLFARLGINFREPFDQIMVDLSKRFAGMDRKVAFSFGMASGIPEDVMNLILQGPSAVQGALSRTKRFAPTEKEAASAAELKKSFTDLELQIVKIGYDLLEKATPAMEKFLVMLQSVGAWAQRHEKIVAVIAGIVAALSGVAALAAGIGAVALAWSALTGAIAAALPVLAVVGIITALAGAILFLYNDYKTWSDGGKSLFNWSDFAAGIDATKNAFDNLADGIEKATDRYSKWLKSHGIDLPAIGSATGEVISGSSAYGLGQSLRQKSDLFMASHSRNTLSQDAINGFILDAIFTGEGFNDHSKGQNIPQRAHNPGDIVYGDFAKSHGATGYVLAQGGKKIATFANDDMGKSAARALINTKSYTGLSPEQILSKWQTGSATALMNGVPNSTTLPASVSSGSQTSTSHTDNSKVTNVGTVNIHNPAGSATMTPSMARGMDWTTLLTQQNFGLMP